MSKNNKPATLFLLILGVAYAVLFYEAEMGVNLLLFDAVLILAALKCRPELAKQKPFVWSVAGMLFAAGCVIVVHGEAALWGHHITYLVVLGFAQARELRFIWYGLLLGAITVFRGPVQWFRSATANWVKRSGRSTTANFGRRVKNIFPALFILIPFLIFYLSGNQRLADGLGALFGWMEGATINFSVIWSVGLFFFGVWLTSGLLFPRIFPAKLTEHQASFDDYLHRRRERRAPVPPTNQLSGFANQAYHYDRPNKKILGLKNEYRQAVITFGLLNGVLALVNITDLTYVWINPGELSASTLSHYVHIGTWNLCFSIALAMLVTLYFFRGNLNFLGGDKVLRPLVRIWLAQNALLALSVALRNYHYIDAYGLALGRVYVGFVLLLMLFGLFTLLRKVDRKLSLSYLFQTNGIALWMLLLAFAAVNWSGVITRYNLATQTAEEIDWDYLDHGLDKRNTFLLLDHPESDVHHRLKGDTDHHRPADWRSWNYADWRNYRATSRPLGLQPDTPSR